MRVAIIHDYLNQYGGAERVLEALHDLFSRSAGVYVDLRIPLRCPTVYRTWDIRPSWDAAVSPAWAVACFRAYVPALIPLGVREVLDPERFMDLSDQQAAAAFCQKA
jgi:hypothetical protein